MLSSAMSRPVTGLPVVLVPPPTPQTRAQPVPVPVVHAHSGGLHVEAPLVPPPPLPASGDALSSADSPPHAIRIAQRTTHPLLGRESMAASLTRDRSRDKRSEETLAVAASVS